MGRSVDRAEKGVTLESKLEIMLRRQHVLGFSWLVP